MANKRLPSPRKYRGRWQAQVTLSNGKRPAESFDTHNEAKQWIAEMIALRDSEHEPELGGPTQTTLAQALRLYAQTYSLIKGGCDAELTRINNYLVGAGMSRIRRRTDPQGKPFIEEYELKIGAKAFAEHRDKRLAKRKPTYDLIAELGRKRCSMLKTMDFRNLMTTMKTDGLSASTIQKEIALLRHMFRLAPKEWSWKGFEDPTEGLKLGTSNSRFVFLTSAQQERMWAALEECDRPEYMGLVAICVETTLRKGSLLQWRWENTDLENRIIKVPSKTGDVVMPLSQHAANILANMPRPETGRVFPFSENAVQEMWKGVRTKAGIPDFQFRDLRHLGATAWARRGLNAHELMRVLGHKTLAQAQSYINLVSLDMLDALDEAAAVSPVVSVSIPAVEGEGNAVVSKRRSRRLAEAALKRRREMVEALTTGEQTRPSEPVPTAAPQASALPSTSPPISPTTPPSAGELVAQQWQQDDLKLSKDAEAALTAAHKPPELPPSPEPVDAAGSSSVNPAQVVRRPSAVVYDFALRKRA